MCGSGSKIFHAHLHRFPGCALHYFVPFWYNVLHNWNELPMIDRNTAALQWWTDQPGLCVCDWTSPDVVGSHLRLRSGQSCLEHIIALFEVWTGMVVALPCIWYWKWCGDADSMLDCGMDGGPCVVF